MNFGQLLLEASNASSSLIIARMQTRDRVNFKKKYYHLYYGPNVIKLLFKVFQMPNEQMLRSRYNYDFPLTVKDPLTNEIVLGEVEFYLVDKTQVKQAVELLACHHEVSAFDQTKIEVKATYFGSDFNYANS